MVFCFFALLRRSRKFSFLFFNLVAKPLSWTGVCNHEPQPWAQTAALLKIPPVSDTRWSRLHNLVFHRLFLMIHYPRGGEFQLSLICFFFFLWYCTKNFLIFISSPHPTSSPTLSFLVNQKLPWTLKRKISPIYPQSRVQLQKVPYITLPLLFSVKMFLLLTQIASLLHLSLASSTAKHLVMMWDCFCEESSCPELPN